jgi:hypothetical protein
MQFPTAAFFAAFKTAGLLVPAVYRLGLAGEVAFDCQWLRPDTLLLGGDAQGTDYRIEFQTADLPPLRVGDPVHIGCHAYTVRQPPQAQGDGYFSQVYLART